MCGRWFTEVRLSAWQALPERVAAIRVSLENLGLRCANALR